MSNNIKEILYRLTEEFLDNTVVVTGSDEITPLNIILSDSIQALEFVMAIEEEFDIEFEDEDIDMEFYQSFDRIKELVLRAQANPAVGAKELVANSRV